MPTSLAHKALAFVLALTVFTFAPLGVAGTPDLIFANGFEASTITACRASGTTCSADTECCNNLCDRPNGAQIGQCAILGSCATADEPCTSVGASGDCCSNACLRNEASGPATCQHIGGCKPTNELCTFATECCSGSCAAAGTTNDGRTIRRCASGITCQPSGELCSLAGSIANCCPPGGGATGCEEASIGLPRCLGGTAGCTLPGNACIDTSECCTESFPAIACQIARSGNQVCCLSAGQSCAFGDTCCSGVCAPGPGGALVCQSAPVATDGACTTSADCATGCCRKNPLGALTCTNECATCTAGQLGESCSESSPCCPGLSCDALQRTCRL